MPQSDVLMPADKPSDRRFAPSAASGRDVEGRGTTFCRIGAVPGTVPTPPQRGRGGFGFSGGRMSAAMLAATRTAESLIESRARCA